MTSDELQLAIQRLIGKAMKAGEVEYVWPYQRLKVHNDLVREAMELIHVWDSGREWHVQEPPGPVQYVVPKTTAGAS